MQVFIGSALVPFLRKRTAAYALTQKAAAAAAAAEVAAEEPKLAASESKAGSSCEAEAELDKGPGSRYAPLIPHS